MLESVLGRHGAPVLSGVKCANMVVLHPEPREDMEGFMETLRSMATPFPLSFEVFCRCENALALYIYNEELLYDALNRPGVAEFLKPFGYDELSLPSAVAHLKRRFSEDAFPHEIGIFLDYPLEDVVRFLDRGGQDYILSGYWKVYGDPEGALRTFRLYDRARANFCYWMERGLSLNEIYRRDLYEVSGDLLERYGEYGGHGQGCVRRDPGEGRGLRPLSCVGH